MYFHFDEAECIEEKNICMSVEEETILELRSYEQFVQIMLIMTIYSVVSRTIPISLRKD